MGLRSVSDSCSFRSWFKIMRGSELIRFEVDPVWFLVRFGMGFELVRGSGFESVFDLMRFWVWLGSGSCLVRGFVWLNSYSFDSC